ncbi:MAG: TonB-dependent receptor [Acidobacteria bacterium]|nr:TonB-dependent receptor [Acidobacteriota bacterium]
MSMASRPLRLAAALFFLCAAPGMTQEDSPAPADEHDHGEATGADHDHEHHTHEFETFSHTVTVTGSWIPGTPEDAAQPVSVLSRDDLEAEGSPSVLDLIRNLPISLGADLGSEQFGVRAGADRSSLNLRGLGASRTLVLLNGDRLTWSPGAIPDQAQLMVDTSVLPMVAVERVEFLRDGGAATYGSDAIAGVMNVITRSHFDGFSFEGKHSVIDGSNGDSEMGLIAGRPFAAGRGHAVSSLGLARRSPIRFLDRHWALTPYADNPRGGWSGTGRPATFHPLSGDPGIRDPNCERVGGAVSNPDSPLCRYQYTAFDNLVQDTRRGQWFTEASWDTEGGWHLGAEILLARSDVPSWFTSPSYPPSKVMDTSRSVRANNPGLIDMARLYPTLYGPYAFCDAPYCLWSGDGDTQDAAGIDPGWQEVAWIRGRTFGQEGPLRSYLRESETQRVAFDFEGVTGETLWAFRASWSAAERKLEDGDVLDYRLRRALAGLGGLACEDQAPNEYDGDGNLSFSLETLRRHAGQGDCRYWIPFSNSIRPHSAVPGVTNPDYDPAFDNGHLFDYLTTTLGTRGETTLFVLEAVASGLLGWNLPGGAAEYAVGAQWRGETYELTPYSIGGVSPRGGALHDLEIYPCPGGPEITSCDSPEGLFVYLPPAFSTEDDRGIGSVFGELSLPLHSSFDSQLSLRFEDYGGDVGSSLDPKVALRWQATEALALRGSLGTTFRGPTLNQTVSGIAETSREDIGPIGTAKPVRIHGDPALDPESATTFNAGLVVERSGLAGAGSRLFVTLDYWRYDFSDPLVIQPFATLIGLACPPADHPLCDPGSPWFDALTISGNVPTIENLDSVSVRIVNGPDIETDGIDFRADFEADAGRGRLRVGTAATYALSWRIDGWELGEAYDARGRLNFDTSLARPLPELKGRFFAGYSRGPLTGRWNLNYTGSFLQDAPLPWGDDYPVDAHATHDVHVSWSLTGNRATLFGSILNLADEDPPLIFRPANYDASTHDPLGRVLCIGVRFEL